MPLFRPAPSPAAIPAAEREIAAFWRDRRLFEKSVENRAAGAPWVWHDGPPTANGRPHNGHILTRVFKDVFPRYRTMRGHRVERLAGWDTHGLPVEVEVEKELGLRGRADIEAYGVDRFVEKCRASVFRYIRDWEEMTERIGHWVDLERAYVTYRRSYVESVWWALSELHRKGLLYRGEKVVWWWAQGGTALSSHEVGLGYREVEDPAVTVALPLEDDPGAALAVWTTTPWTLPSNLYAAARPGVEYEEVEDEAAPPDGDRRRLIVAAALRETLAAKLGRPLTPLRRFAGEALVGRRYRPPFPDYWNRYRDLEGRLPGGAAVPAFWRVLAADFVELDQGTGLVHEAPAFGEVDHDLHRATVAAYENGDEIPLPNAVGPDGRFTAAVPWLEGRWVKDADPEILRRLKEDGRLIHREMIRHEYPFCWRAKEDALIQYARPAWFLRTTARKEQALANSGAVDWLPDHIREGRFGDFLRNNVDWALSRERFWGTPLNLWINDETGRRECPASVAEIEAKNPEAFAAFREAKQARPDLDPDLMVHKPWVDAVTWTNPGEPGVYRRVPEVIDCWFDSGAMPFAQWGFPRQNRDRFLASFPADYITEAVDQTRGWFYSLLMISTLLFDEDTCSRLDLPAPAGPHPFRQCLVLGHVTDPKGRKESKSLGNYTPPEQTFAEAGSDAFRWFFLSAGPPWAGRRHSLDRVRAAAREFPLKIRNVQSFFTIYAGIDAFDPRVHEARPPAERAPLDRWILSHLEATTASVGAALDRTDAYEAARALAAFAESLSNWWLRRSRRRFWSAGLDPEKRDALTTLYQALTRLSRIAAPLTPFLAEDLHRSLVVGPYGSEAPESVHLTDWPAPEFPLDPGLNEEMAAVREIASLGLRVRTEQGIRVRQPLAAATVATADRALGERLAADREYRELLADELNVKEVVFRAEAEGDLEWIVRPDFRRLGPKLGKRMQPARRALAALPGAEVKRRLDADGAILLRIPGGAGGKGSGKRSGKGNGEETVRIEAADLTVEPRARSGRAAAAGEVATVGLDPELTDALREEGRYRELLNRVQTFRKELDLPYTARIRLGFAAAEAAKAAAVKRADLAKQISAGAKAVAKESAARAEQFDAVATAASLLAVARERERHFLDETLSVALVAGALPGAARREIEVEGEKAILSLEVVAESAAEGASA